MATDKPDLTRVWANGAPAGNVVDPDTTTPGKFNAGWQAEVPPFEHFNFLQKMFTQGLVHANEQGIMVWDTETTYPQYGMAKGSDGQIYVSQQEQSGNDPVGDGGTNWVSLQSTVAPDASESTKGIAAIADEDEAIEGTDDTKIMTPSKVKTAISQITAVTAAFASCSAADPLEFVSDYQPDDLNKSPFISSSDGETGVLVNTQAGAYFDIVLPYMVIIGDSIAEGHPALHGRLHPNGVVGYDPNYKSQPGQLSYEFARIFKLPVVNQAIGGETSVQIRNRWSRDVLGQTFDPGDGRGNNTMPFNNQLPHAVYLHVGINDVFQGVTTPTIQDNFNFFAQSCRDNNIILIVDNIGVEATINAPREAQATEINNWLVGAFKTAFPEVQIIDYLDWSSDGTGDFTNLKPGMFADNVHPNKVGYADFAKYSTERVTQSVFFSSLALNSTIEGTVGSFSRITGITFNGNNYNIDGEIARIDITSLSDGDDPNYRITATTFEEITGPNYMGYAQIFSEFKSSKSEQIFPPIVGGAGVVAAGVILNAALAPPGDYHSFNISSVDTSDIANGNVTVSLAETATHLVVNMVGTSNDTYNFHPRWFSGVIPNGQTDWAINLTRISDGVVASNPIYHQYQIIAYNFLGS